MRGVAEFAIYHTCVGYIRIEHKQNRLTLLHIVEGEPTDYGERNSFTDGLFSQVEEYLCGERKELDVEIDIEHLTPFQQRVLRELMLIPYGQTCSYKDVALAISHPKAARAVGMAANRNPYHIIIPCHRVIGSTGRLIGYAAGIGAKSQLLEIERVELTHSKLTRPTDAKPRATEFT